MVWAMTGSSCSRPMHVVQPRFAVGAFEAAQVGDEIEETAHRHLAVMRRPFG